MNICFLTDDKALVDAFERSAALPADNIIVYDDPQLLGRGLKQQQTDVLIASDCYFNSEQLCDFTEKLHCAGWQQRSVLLLSDKQDAAHNNAMLKESLAGGWNIIHSEQSTASIVEQLSRYIHGEKDRKADPSNRIVHFIGSTPNIGTTVAAFGIAVRMAMLSGRTVAYLCLNLKSSKLHRYIGVDEPGFSLDGVRAELKSMSLSGDRLRQQCHKVKNQHNLYVLFGNMLREQAEFYTVEDMECLLQAAADTFDYCLVETNAYWDNAATIATMMNAGMRLLVTTPQLGSFQEDVGRWLDTMAPVFGLTRQSFDLLITQKEGGIQSGSYSSRDIRRETAMQRIGEIRKSKEIDSLLNQGRLLDAVAGDSLLGYDVQRIAGTLLTLFGDSTLKISGRKNWLQLLLPSFKLQERGVGFVRK